MSSGIEIYGDSISGNCYKLKLACAQLAIDYTWHEVDIMAGETRTEEYLAMNPNGRDRFEKANVLRWMFFEQYSHEPYIATSRFIIQYLGRPEEREGDLESRKGGGYMALDVMERELTDNDFIANDAYSLADIALYAYTHVAGEGGFDLSGYPRINAWLERVESQPGFVPMSKNPPGSGQSDRHQ